jgi:hypothetical protein
MRQQLHMCGAVLCCAEPHGSHVCSAAAAAAACCSALFVQWELCRYTGKTLVLAKKSAWYYEQNLLLVPAQQAQAELINKLLAAASRQGLARLLAAAMLKKGVMQCVVAAVVQQVRATASISRAGAAARTASVALSQGSCTCLACCIPWKPGTPARHILVHRTHALTRCYPPAAFPCRPSCMRRRTCWSRETTACCVTHWQQHRLMQNPATAVAAAARSPSTAAAAAAAAAPAVAHAV